MVVVVVVVVIVVGQTVGSISVVEDLGQGQLHNHSAKQGVNNWEENALQTTHKMAAVRAVTSQGSNVSLQS